VRPLAVLSDKRVATLPQVPTSKEAGIQNFEVTVWYGMLMPPNMPKEIVSRMNSELQKALSNGDVKEKLANAGVQPWTSSPDEFAKFIRTETARYAKVIKDAGIHAE
jgi:tripartite-type tricarboxylate transporter receptor subunit TctC